MTWFEILLVVLIAGYCAYVIFGKKKHGCCGDCGNCSGCAKKENE